mgnify:CR=1 FL=1
MPPTPEPADDGGLWDRMLSSAQAEFSLSAASYNIDLTSDRERTLVETALAAGVVGALAVMREDDEGSTRH